MRDRRIEIQADDVADFVHKLRVRRQLEGIDAMRLQTEGAPDSRDGCFRQPCDLRHSAGRPLRGVERGAFERPGDQIDHHIVRRFSRGARPRFVRQAFESAGAKPLPPLADAIGRRRHARRDRPIGEPLGTCQHDASAKRQPLRRLRTPCALLQRSSFVVRQHQRFTMTSSSHAALSTSATAEVQDFF